ncbi:hypothetical protein G8A07_26825 [Roseateles sp. DAIF2]|uniref:hypothetical protein n=1 Tax=Roseateles sp. DAIF2 TaxID=2714952 RepID=UPI0018A29852|nr:hypothetical protein [Roseateles sp. DAIF2]QPF76183.1 hypothetical protein G8A07_26825 [Roseateles sp. DAIF2]
MRSKALAPTSILVLLIIGCAGTPQPDWQLESRSALDRATTAWLAGNNTRVVEVDAARARAELSRTGRPELLARAELLLCAARVAALEFDNNGCPAFEVLAQDAGAAENAYAEYLAGKVPARVELLPEAQRGLATGAVTAERLAATIKADDPLARLVAAGTALRREGDRRLDRGVALLAIDTASAQGWRRPLLAWLHIGIRQAEAAGDEKEAERLGRRAAVVSGR